MSIRDVRGVGGPIVVRLRARNRKKRMESIERLSTGSRIPRAKYDPAGSAVAEKLDVEATSKRQALRNLNDTLGMLHLAESGVAEIGELVKRMREVTVQAASESMSDRGRAALQQEFAGLLTSVNRIATDAVWGDLPLLTYQRVDIGFVVDASASMPQEMIQVKNALADFQETLGDRGIEAGLGLAANTPRDGIDSTDRLADIGDGNFITELENIEITGGVVDPWSALMNASGADDVNGSLESDNFGWTRTGKARIIVNITDTYREKDAIAGSESQQDVADALAAEGVEVHSIHRPGHNSYYADITATTGGSMHDIGNGSGSGIASAMNDIANRVGEIFGDRGVDVQAGSGASDDNRISVDLPVNATTSGLGLDLITIDTVQEAQDALDSVRDALVKVNGFRAKIGIHMNRLQSAISYETNAHLQVVSAQSRIEDLDFAEEAANLARLEFLERAADAILSQSINVDERAIELIS